MICLTTKLKTWFYEEIQGTCILNSLMEFISWTKEGPEITTRFKNSKCVNWFVVKPSEIGMKDGISHLSAGVLVFSFQLAITPPLQMVIG